MYVRMQSISTFGLTIASVSYQQLPTASRNNKLGNSTGLILTAPLALYFSFRYKFVNDCNRKLSVFILMCLPTSKRDHI